MTALAVLPAGPGANKTITTTFAPCLMGASTIVQLHVPRVRYAPDPLSDGPHDRFGNFAFATGHPSPVTVGPGETFPARPNVIVRKRIDRLGKPSPSAPSLSLPSVLSYPLTTQDYKALRELSDRQLIAIGALIDGATHAEAAERAGVHRVTVSKWVAHHPAVQAELNRRRKELAEVRTQRLRELDAAALDAAAACLEAGDGEFALKWLKLRGLNMAVFPDTGPTDPEEIIDGLVAVHAAAAQNSDMRQLDDTLNRIDRKKMRTDIEGELVETLGPADVT
jgi:hypothetical protein